MSEYQAGSLFDDPMFRERAQALFAMFSGVPLEEVRQMMRDAERYQWLREGDNDEFVLLNADGSPVPALDPDATPACFLPRLERLDAAIDAAMYEDQYTLTDAGREALGKGK